MIFSIKNNSKSIRTSLRRRWELFKISNFVIFHHFFAFLIVQVTANLGTQSFPDHFETIILHHFCRTSREKTCVFHVNVEIIHTHQFFNPKGSNNCGPRPAPKPRCIQITVQLEAAEQLIPTLQIISNTMQAPHWNFVLLDVLGSIS